MRIRDWAGSTLLAKPEPCDRRAVPLHVLARQVREESAPLSYELEKTSPRVKVVLVGAQVIGKSVDPLGEESNLNFRRTSVLRMRAKLSDDCLFLLGLKRHFCGSLSGKT